jgi:uncharacterized membrane protein
MSTNERSSTGLDANIAAALSYFFGLVSGVIFFAVETESRFVKFHAMQSIMASVAALVIYIVYTVVWMILWRLPFLGVIAGIFGWFGWALLALAFLGLWLYCMVRAFQGERFKLPYIGELAEQQVWPSGRGSRR